MSPAGFTFGDMLDIGEICLSRAGKQAPSTYGSAAEEGLAVPRRTTVRAVALIFCLCLGSLG